MDVSETVEIARSPEAVFWFVADPANDPRWCKKVKSVSALEPGRWRVVHQPVPLRGPMRLTVEHVQLDPPRSIRLREEDEASVFEVEYRVDPAGQGTRFTQTSQFAWKKLPRFLHRLFARGVRRDIRDQLAELKRVLEAG